MSNQNANNNNNNNKIKDNTLDAWVIFEHLYGAQRKVWFINNHWVVVVVDMIYFVI